MYSTDLVVHICRTSEPRRKQSRRLDESAYLEQTDREKKDETVCFQSTNEESII